MRTAIVHASSILGKALHERLQQSQVLSVDALVTTHDEEVGTLSEAAGAAALTQLLTGEEADIYFVCGTPDEQRAVAATVQRGVVIHVEPTGGASLNYGVAGRETKVDSDDSELLTVHCPSPVATALTHLLLPVAGLDLFASAVVLKGASSSGGAALDELLEQTRSLLSFSGEMPTEALKTQLAFNAVGFESAGDLESEVSSLLPGTPLAVRTLDVGIFHGVGLAVELQPRSDEITVAGLAQVVVSEVASRPYIETRAADDNLSTIDAAGSDGILLAEIQPGAHGVGLWAVFDNLTLAARNAVDVAEALGERWLKVN